MRIVGQVLHEIYGKGVTYHLVGVANWIIDSLKLFPKNVQCQSAQKLSYEYLALYGTVKIAMPYANRQ